MMTKHVELDPGDGENEMFKVLIGDGAWEGYDCAVLAPEEVVAVASPAHAETMRCGDDLEALGCEKLIHETQMALPTVEWPEWFAAFHVDYRDEGAGLRMSEYLPVLQAAIAGQGVALGWEHLIGPPIEQGLLVQIGTRRLRTNRSLYLIWSNRLHLSANAEAVKSWMLGAASGQATGASAP